MTASIVGWAHTPFGKFDTETVESLVVKVAVDALADAGISAGDVDEIVGRARRAWPAWFTTARPHFSMPVVTGTASWNSTRSLIPSPLGENAPVPSSTSQTRGAALSRGTSDEPIIQPSTADVWTR